VPEIMLPYNWEPRNYQMPAWEYMEGPGENKRAVEVWHRRAGKDLFAINLVAVKSQERVGLYWHLLPTYKQGRAIVWNGMTRDGRKFLDHFPEDLVASQNSTEMRVTFKNGSQYQVVGTDDVDSLVGTNPIGCIFSEYSLHDPGAWDLLRPILLENGGWALFIYTARGRNHGYTLLEMARANKKWFSQVLVAGSNGTRRPDGTPVFSDEMIQEERDTGMAEEMVQQEYFCSFDSPFIGSYYGPQMLLAERQGRIMENIPHDPLLPVNTWWDLGMDDSTTIWFVQEYGMELRIIDYYENSGEGLAHYAKVLSGQTEGGDHRQEYLYGKHLAPHDVEVRELGTGKSRRQVARDLGLKYTVAPKHEVVDGIEAVRNVIPICYFSMSRCQRGVEALRQYRKAYDEDRKVFRSTPLHDWTSHAADAFRIGAMGRRLRSKYGQSQLQQRATDDHDYMSGRPQEHVAQGP
jgi:phage terminase large subunit